MRRSRRIASAKDSRRKHYEQEMKQEARQEKTAVRESDNGAPGYGSAIDPEEQGEEEEEEEEENSRLISFTRSGNADGLCYFRNVSSLFRLPLRPATAGKDFTATVRTFFANHLRKLPGTSHLRYYCDAVKRKCSASFTRSAGCFPFGFPVEEGESAAEKRRKSFDDFVYELKPVLRLHRRFSLHELRMATSEWSETNKLGEGLSGTVYRGELASSGETIAVKVLKGESTDPRLSFAQELKILCRVHNDYIQPLIGYCVEDRQLRLVYPYMPRGSLDDLLHGLYEQPKLSWQDRHKVALGVTEALYHLHTKCNPPIIHRDIKPSNILLTIKNEAKLSDFGLALEAPSQEVTGVDTMGTIGYCAPECFDGRVSTKSDVYSLGILLLELVSGRRPSDGSPGQRSLAIWAWQRVIESKTFGEEVVGHGPLNMPRFTDGMVDPDLGTFYSLQGLQSLICIALLCIHPLETHRLSISEVHDFMRKEQAATLHCLVMEKYQDACYPAFSSMDQDKHIRRREEDQRKKYMEMAMQDVEEHSLMLHNTPFSL